MKKREQLATRAKNSVDVHATEVPFRCTVPPRPAELCCNSSGTTVFLLYLKPRLLSPDCRVFGMLLATNSVGCCVWALTLLLTVYCVGDVFAMHVLINFALVASAVSAFFLHSHEKPRETVPVRCIAWTFLAHSIWGFIPRLTRFHPACGKCQTQTVSPWNFHQLC